MKKIELKAGVIRFLFPDNQTIVGIIKRGYILHVSPFNLF